MKRLRLICILGFLVICQYVFGASPIQETQTPTSYTMRWNETGKNGGTVKGIFTGPMKDGKRNGRWTADVKFNLFGDDDFRTGTITMVRNYKDGVPDGPYSYNFDVNWRDGAYNPYQGKWIYGSPSGYKETVSGSFNMGRPDGAWSIKSDKKLGYECQMTFKNGVPVGKRVYRDGINGKGNEEFNEEGLLVGIVSDDGNGWRYKDAESIPSDKKIPYNRQRFFHLETEDDYNYFARAAELYAWLAAYPYDASNENISYEGYVVNDGEDLEYIEYVGSPEYIKESQASNERKKESLILRAVCDEVQSLNSTYLLKIEEFERNAPKFNSKEFESIYKAKYHRNLLDSLSSTINRIEEIPIVKEIMGGVDKGAYQADIIKEHIGDFRKLNQQYSPDNIQILEARVSDFLKRGRKICEMINIDPTEVKDEEIEKYYGGQYVRLADMSYHLDNNEQAVYSKKNDFERSLREKRYQLKNYKEQYQPDENWIDKLEDEISTIEKEYADFVALDGCVVTSENPDQWVKYANRKGAPQIVSPGDIRFRDFVLYVAPRGLDKPKKDSWPSERKLIETMNAMRRIIPETIPLSQITNYVTLYNSSGFAYDRKKRPLTELDEKQLKKLWKEYAKHYGIPFEK